MVIVLYQISVDIDNTLLAVCHLPSFHLMIVTNQTLQKTCLSRVLFSIDCQLALALISPVEISSRWLWVILAPESWARIAPGARLGQDKDRPALAASSSIGLMPQSDVRCNHKWKMLRLPPTWDEKLEKENVGLLILPSVLLMLKYIVYIAMAVTCSSETIAVTWYSLCQSCLLNI